MLLNPSYADSQVALKPTLFSTMINQFQVDWTSMESEYNTDIKTYQNLECIAQDVSNRKFTVDPDMSQDLSGIY